MLKYSSISLKIFAAVITICFWSITMTLIGFFARKKAAKNSNGSIDCDEEGIKFDSASHKSTTPWSRIQCVRAFEYSLAVIPKADSKAQAVIVPVENLENIAACIKQYDAGVEIIR